MNIIFHIDVNNAFLSWTAVDMLRNGYEVDIRNIPSVIGGDEEQRRGIVVAKSPVAKKFGVVTAEPLYMARRKCPGLKVFPGNHDLYIKESNKLYEYLKNFTPDIERYSIDECFLDLSGTKYLYNDYLKLARDIQKYINDNLGITVNIGIACNRLCAKMASDFEKPNKIHTLFPNEIESKMWPLPVGELFMVGKKSAEILNKIGIYTIGDLAHADISLLTKYFKNNASNMINSARGIDNTKVSNYVPKDQSISVSETLPKDVDNLVDLQNILLYQADRVGIQLRKEKKYTGTIAVIFKNKDFISYSHQKKLDVPINSTEEIYKVAVNVLKKGWRGDKIRLIGIRLGSLSEKRVKQFSLFDMDTEDDVDKIQDVLDKINDKYGSCKITVASMKKNKNISD